MKTLCGRRSCPRICEQVCHCPAGQVRSIHLLNAYAIRRLARQQEKQEENERSIARWEAASVGQY